ncbi:MAG: tryptophan synthase subunit alpha [Verrucomicrobiota bacterium]|nr:tryptophan synthase subunit alpha [Verrucomicrobiota bacterium]
MDRIAQTFARARAEDRACFIAYVCAGDPDYATSLEICRTLLANGVDILELGVPFSDPLADGIANQLAAQRALEAGITQTQVFDLVRDIRKFSEAPILFYTYYNMVFARTETAYAAEAKAAGLDGALVLDLPPEEAGNWLTAAKAVDLKTIFLIAPTTPPERMSVIAGVASGFIYYVSREGVTGERASLATNLTSAVAEINKHTVLPVAVGFGISTREHVAGVSAVADGVVVGSALVNVIAHNLGNKEALLAQLGAKTADLAAGLKRTKVG